MIKIHTILFQGTTRTPRQKEAVFMFHSKFVYTILLLIFAMSGFTRAGETIVRNPATPRNPKAGYDLKLVEVFRIDVTDDRFYFKDIDDIQISADGSIVVEDIGQVLKFSPDGKFIRNFFKKGEGPGEGLEISRFRIHGNEIALSYSSLKKICLFDFDTGKLKHEFKTPNTSFFSSYYLFHAGKTCISTLSRQKRPAINSKRWTSKSMSLPFLPPAPS